MAIILKVGIVLIAFQSKVIYLYALPIICLRSFMRGIPVKLVEPGQGTIVFALMGSRFLGWDGME